MENFLGLGLLFFIAGSFSGLLSSQKKPLINSNIGLVMAGLGSLIILGVSIQSLLNDYSLIVNLPGYFGMFEHALVLDKLAAFFVLVISLAGVIVSIYSFGYNQHFAPRKNLGYFIFLYNLFLLAMVMVVMAGDVLLFIIMWEVMSLTSYLLVNYEHEDKEVRQAGFIYVVMTHLGTVFITIAFLLLAKQAGSLHFSSLALGSQGIETGLASIVFISALLGFGTKAGLVPLHIWLPRAHPAAPTNVSALMSGVMVKTAVYGLLRFLFTLLPQGTFWWGYILIIVGIVSAVLGAIYAIVQNDIKVLLAYSTVENIGIIFIGLGTAMILYQHNFTALALMALIASMYHLLNHTVFKTLLFMGAGAVLYSTHTKNMDLLGGLLKVLPRTGFYFLIGIISLIALPPLNGFVGEWLTLKSIISLATVSESFGVKILALSAIAALALVGALVAMVGVKVFGTAFLAIPRSKLAKEAKEVPLSMQVAMALSSLLCLCLGLFPVYITRILRTIGETYWSTNTTVVKQVAGWSNTGNLTFFAGNYFPLLLAAFLILIIFLTKSLLPIFFKKTNNRYDQTWTCGIVPDHTMEYSGAGFTEPVRIFFRHIFLPERKVEEVYTNRPYFSKSIHFRDTIKPIIEIYLYKPFMAAFLGFSKVVRNLQTGSVHTYLAYIFVTLVALLALAR